MTEHDKKETFHRFLERKVWWMSALVLVVLSIGGILEIVPLAIVPDQVVKIDQVKPYTPLEQLGRDIYVAEGCYTCHSQMIRPFRDEVERYAPNGGGYSKAGEFVYDRPFQWGSKRIGPDLHRLGMKYPDAWHYEHMRYPSDVTEGSIMPAYPWLYEEDTNYSVLEDKLKALRQLGHPYSQYEVYHAETVARDQAEKIASKLRENTGKLDADPNKKIIALIAYLQRVGLDIRRAESP